MALCPCNGCGGHGAYVAEQERIVRERAEDFQRWLDAGRPPLREWFVTAESNPADETPFLEGILAATARERQTA